MEDRIITIATTAYSRAQLIKGRLEAEGIDCFLTNINLVQPGVASGVKIKILEKDAEKAYRIIEEMMKKFGEEKMSAFKSLKNIRRILVPVDFSETSLNACNFALGVANKLKAEIRLLHCYFNPLISTDPFLENSAFGLYMENVISSIEEEAEKQMGQLKDKLEEQIAAEGYEHVRISHILVRGVTENVILNYIEKYDPGVVVMGSKGHGRGLANYIGSVARRIIEKSEVPVLVIPEKSTFWGIKYINRVLYATNFDDSDFRSLRQLMTLVRPFGMKIYCAHIYSGDSDPVDQIKMESLKNHFLAECEGYPISCEMLMHTDIVEGLEDYIEKRDIDLIALTTRKRGVIERLFNPGIARQMLFHNGIPLLVFHS